MTQGELKLVGAARNVGKSCLYSLTKNVEKSCLYSLTKEEIDRINEAKAIREVCQIINNAISRQLNKNRNPPPLIEDILLPFFRKE